MDSFYQNQDFKYFIAKDAVTTKYSSLMRCDVDNTTSTSAAKTMILFNYHHHYSHAFLNLFYLNSLSHLDCSLFYGMYSAFALDKYFTNMIHTFNSLLLLLLLLLELLQLLMLQFLLLRVKYFTLLTTAKRHWLINFTVISINISSTFLFIIWDNIISSTTTTNILPTLIIFSLILSMSTLILKVLLAICKIWIAIWIISSASNSISNRFLVLI